MPRISEETKRQLSFIGQLSLDDVTKDEETRAFLLAGAEFDTNYPPSRKAIECMKKLMLSGGEEEKEKILELVKARYAHIHEYKARESQRDGDGYLYRFCLDNPSLSPNIRQMTVMAAIDSVEALIKSTAFNKFKLNQWDIEDTFQEVALFITEKIDTFDPTKGQFSTWVMNTIKDKSIIVKNPHATKYNSDIGMRISKAVAELEKQGVSNPTSVEVARVASLQNRTTTISPQQVENYWARDKKVASLDDCIGVSDQGLTPEQEVINRESQLDLRKQMLAVVSDKDVFYSVLSKIEATGSVGSKKEMYDYHVKRTGDECSQQKFNARYEQMVRQLDKLQHAARYKREVIKRPTTSQIQAINAFTTKEDKNIQQDEADIIASFEETSFSTMPERVYAGV